MTALPSPGDILITLRTCGDLRRGDVVTVSHTSPSGEYVYLDEQDGKISSRADAFMVAVKRPWHAWADPEWERRAREAAERFVREGLAVEATAPAPNWLRPLRCVCCDSVRRGELLWCPYHGAPAHDVTKETSR